MAISKANQNFSKMSSQTILNEKTWFSYFRASPIGSCWPRVGSINNYGGHDKKWERQGGVRWGATIALDSLDSIKRLLHVREVS